MKTVVIVVWALVVSYSTSHHNRDTIVIDDIADRESCIAMQKTFGARSDTNGSQCVSYRKIVVVDK